MSQRSLAKAWLNAARPKTLPASIAPVILGAGYAWHSLGQVEVGRTILAIIVALSLQIGVNYANDYSDGIRGTDDATNRVGPQRLTGNKIVAPRAVLTAALSSFALAGIAGIILIAWSQTWLLLGLGVGATVAAWFYTGGKHPYGYIGGIAEILVFLFFGLLATCGTTWTQVQTIPGQEWAAASGIGLLSCALLMVNNIRDIPGDKTVGKRTLAVRLGDKHARYLTVGYIFAAALLAAPTSVIAAIITAIAGTFAIKPVWAGACGLQLIPALKWVGLLTLAYGVGLGTIAWLW